MKRQSAHTLNPIIIKQVCLLMQWTAEGYVNYMVKMGKQFLQATLHNYPADVDRYVESAAFWKWWATNWLQRDEQFIIGKETTPMYLRQGCYKELHDPELLKQTLRINIVVMQASDKKEGV